MSGSNNDVNVFDIFSFVNNMLWRPSQDLSFIVNGKEYLHYYLLADGIYLQWSCFIQTIHALQDEKRPHYNKM